MTPADSIPAPAPSEATLPFDRAYADLTQALQDALSTTAQRDSVNARFTEYLTLLQAAMSGQDLQAQCAQAYGIYIAALQEALAGAPQQQRAIEAFDRYLLALREAWTTMDPRTLTPRSVASIAQQIMAAASTVAGIAPPPTGMSGDVSPPDLSSQ